MDELEKKPDAPQASAKKKPEQKNSFDNRKKLMYVLCGGYLLYLALKMGRDYPGLAASGVWSSDRIIALCGTIAFSIIGFFYVKHRGKGKLAKAFIPTITEEKRAAELPEGTEALPEGTEESE